VRRFLLRYRQRGPRRVRARGRTRGDARSRRLARSDGRERARGRSKPAACPMRCERSPATIVTLADIGTGGAMEHEAHGFEGHFSPRLVEGREVLVRAYGGRRSFVLGGVVEEVAGSIAFDTRWFSGEIERCDPKMSRCCRCREEPPVRCERDGRPADRGCAYRSSQPLCELVHRRRSRRSEGCFRRGRPVPGSTATTTPRAGPRAVGTMNGDERRTGVRLGPLSGLEIAPNGVSPIRTRRLRVSSPSSRHRVMFCAAYAPREQHG